jgi:hypothetical protein
MGYLSEAEWTAEREVVEEGIRQANQVLSDLSLTACRLYWLSNKGDAEVLIDWHSLQCLIRNALEML